VIYHDYGGVNEIGGNKILLQDKDTRVFLDFGKGFSRRAKFFEEYINPRVANGIEDFLTMGLLPDIGGVYRDPDAYNAVNEWMNYRASFGEEIIGDSWVLRDTW
jgi:mRNA degradation ribonuclease J1/J2